MRGTKHTETNNDHSRRTSSGWSKRGLDLAEEAAEKQAAQSKFASKRVTRDACMNERISRMQHGEAGAIQSKQAYLLMKMVGVTRPMPQI
jgi:hypothetical protein